MVLGPRSFFMSNPTGVYRGSVTKQSEREWTLVAKVQHLHKCCYFSVMRNVFQRAVFPVLAGGSRAWVPRCSFQNIEVAGGFAAADAQPGSALPLPSRRPQSAPWKHPSSSSGNLTKIQFAFKWMVGEISSNYPPPPLTVEMEIEPKNTPALHPRTRLPSFSPLALSFEYPSRSYTCMCMLYKHVLYNISILYKIYIFIYSHMDLCARLSCVISSHICSVVVFFI